MSSFGVEFVLKASSKAVTKALAEVNAGVLKTKTGLAELSRSGGLRAFGLAGAGVGTFVAGLVSATNAAREMRDELQRTGQEVPDDIARIARAGDGLMKLKDVSNQAFGAVAGFMDKVGLAVGKVVYGADAAADAVRGLEEGSKAAAKAVEAARLSEAKGERAKFQRDEVMRTGSEGDRMNILLKENLAIREKIKAAAEGTAEREKAMLELDKNLAALRESEGKIQKEATDNRTKEAAAAERMAKAAAEEAQKRRDADKTLIDKFAPSVEELAAKDIASGVGANDPRRMARQALAEEERARLLFDRGDFKGGLAAAQKAQGLRTSLESQASEMGALTPKAAEQAFSTALQDTNAKLEKIEAALGGMLKAQ